MIFKGIKINKFIIGIFTFFLTINAVNILPLISKDIKDETIAVPTKDSINESLYIIGPGDFIRILFLNDETLNTASYVLNDGTLSVPIVGNLKVSGLSISQAKDTIEEKLGKEFIVSPSVRLAIEKLRPIRISITGEVERPGIYKLGNNISSSLIEAIQKSGGVTPFANLTKVSLTRKLPGFNKDYKKTTLNLLDVILEGDMQQNLLLFDEDRIFIPKADITASEKSKLAATNLTPSKINVYIIGEVLNPGVRIISSNTPLIQAIMTAGGPTYWRGNRGNVDLVRTNRNGTITKKKVAINLTKSASRKNNPLLKNGDIIRVNRTKIATATDAITGVTKPFTGLINAYSIFKIIN